MNLALIMICRRISFQQIDLRFEEPSVITDTLLSFYLQLDY